MTFRLPIHVLATFLTATGVLAGCVQQGTSAGTGDTSSSGGDTTEQDIAQLEDLRKELEGSRVKVDALGTQAADMHPVGNRIFFTEYPGLAPTLHSYDAETNTRVNYTFAIGADNNYMNFRPSEDIVVTVDAFDSPLVYRAYAQNAPDQLVGQFEMETPGSGIRWWAYAPDHSDVYVVRTGDVTELLKWTVGDAEPHQVLVFEDLGYQLGEFWDFGVGYGKLIFIEAGRIWSLDLATQKLTWLRNETEATAANWDTQGVLFQTAEGPFYYSYAKDELIDVKAAIAASDYRLNATYEAAHTYYEGMTKYQLNAGYIGQMGLFTYDLERRTVRPILINSEREEVTVEYKNPIFLDNGAVFVQGFEGFDGPIYRVDFPF
jgi:hypothetical protein